VIGRCACHGEHLTPEVLRTECCIAFSMQELIGGDEWFGVSRHGEDSSRFREDRRLSIITSRNGYGWRWFPCQGPSLLQAECLFFRLSSKIPGALTRRVPATAILVVAG
jgi:hypothetical protein